MSIQTLESDNATPSNQRQYYVRDFLGHKSLKNTEIYMTVERTLFGETGNDEFTVRVSEDPEEIRHCLK